MILETEQIQRLQEIAVEAGRQILEIYESESFEEDQKADGSPLTAADRAAHESIVAALEAFSPSFPVLSEESSERVMNQRQEWTTFWLVDPLDGTKEFIKRNGEFTVNIALIDQNQPEFGVVHAPVLQRTYYGGPAYGAFRVEGEGAPERIETRGFQGGVATVVASRSHRGEEVDQFLERLQAAESPAEIQSMGSSLKLCLVAEGAADIYPRLGPTSEWDTAAAHAVVLGAGGTVVNKAGVPLTYNKESILNPHFLVEGDSTYDWLRFVQP